jgi:Uma2 family endonuclease
MEVKRRRFTVHDYHRMGEAGILHEDDRVELIEGELVEMTAIGTRHFSCVNRLNRLLVMHVGDDAIVSVQNPVRLNEYNEPQPDLTVIRPRDYLESLPKPEDVLLLIEVSDTTLAYDRGVKLPLYARAGIREVWIVDLLGETQLVEEFGLGSLHEPEGRCPVVDPSSIRVDPLDPPADPHLRHGAGHRSAGVR